MISYKPDGDLFNNTEQAIVNAVNTVGVMGGVIALRFKQLYPDMYADYVLHCSLGFATGALHASHPQW